MQNNQRENGKTGLNLQTSFNITLAESIVTAEVSVKMPQTNKSASGSSVPGQVSAPDQGEPPPPQEERSQLVAGDGGAGAAREGEGDSGEGSEEDEEEDEEEEQDNDFDELDEENAGKKKRGSSEKQAAAALCISVGSFSDPDDLPGLAHFLEHMVFMGSEKYPAENGFDAFLKKHRGSDNGSTDCERTIFQSDVQRKYFREALDRWAQFFICPLMIEDAIDREVEAVDSEYQLARPSDSHSKEMLFGSLAKPGHPLSKFCWGNAQTLKNEPYVGAMFKEFSSSRLFTFMLLAFLAF